MKTIQKNLHVSNLCFKLDDFRVEIQRRDQEIMSMAAKMKTLEEQHQVGVCELFDSNGSFSHKTFHYNFHQLLVYLLFWDGFIGILKEFLGMLHLLGLSMLV